MKIIVDKEAKETITRLCDVVLRATGLQGAETVMKVLQALKEDNVEKPQESS